jgi:hypothetical protein
MVFSMYISWLYACGYNEFEGTRSAFELDIHMQDTDVPQLDTEIHLGIAMWLLAEYLQDRRLQNYAMRRLIHAIHCRQCGIHYHTLHYVHEKTEKGSLLGLFVEDMVALNWGDEQRIRGESMGWGDGLSEDKEVLSLVLSACKTPLKSVGALILVIIWYN